ncbi:hypothetical protein M2444_006777 [Paenibacillus sp. PastF-3]|uniref:hypothetical protein n=1 Tax=Paenibacillus sp. PastF-3 TaxID=2940626 RepID=UPI002475B158|nr:hypothetical protein [Paenibacillus sp. PastF-3]MDH6374913.1 hypothetical protein [Paenibacillus sp. PastF-3]
MKNTWIKGFLAIVILLATFGGSVGSAGATANTVKPVMDNLSKYGLKKDVDLPVTVTAGGLSYTLEKIMIFDAKSKDAQALAKKYGYDLEGSKYFIWTKITVENKSGNTVQRNIKDLSNKWRLNFGDFSEGEAFNIMPSKLVYAENSKDALWTWVLKPGEKLSTYQGFLYSGKFNYFVIWLDNKGTSATKYIVNEKK